MRRRFQQTALFPGNEDRVGYWLTPPDLMQRLEQEFHFTMDACPYPRPAGFDALKEPWGERTFVNPPFVRGNSLSEWSRKAIAEANLGKTVVLTLPLSGWFEDLMAAGAEVRSLGRVRWQNPKGEAQDRPRWATALFVLRPKVGP